jgi:mono/diheme cytochrome c family protein
MEPPMPALQFRAWVPDACKTGLRPIASRSVRRWTFRTAMYASALGLALMLPASAVVAEPLGKRVELAPLVTPDAPTTAVILDDPVYKTRKLYAGLSLAALLRKAWPDADRWAAEGAELVLHCADGYAPSMDLKRALGSDGVVAIRDLDRPASDPWEPFTHGKETITPAPAYLVWSGADPADANYKWPYQLVAVSVETFDKRYGKAAPGETASAEAQRGFRLFVQNCISCHSVNLVGGDLAPELNVPRNVTEYWSPEHLAAFIKAPETYRLRSKMPNFSHLPDADRDAVVAYLKAMVGRR